MYVFSCRDLDLTKIGFSRDPLQRIQTLHRRWFEFFNMDRGLLIETERVSEARRIEREFLVSFAERRADQPYEVRLAAAGHTEWFASVEDAALERAMGLCETTGFALHRPLRNWMRTAYAPRMERLFDWAETMLDASDYERFNVDPAARNDAAQQALRDTLDTAVALEFPLPRMVSERVLTWFQCCDRT